MSSKNGQPSGKRSTLSRAPSRRKQGQPVTIEDAIDPEDHLHRVAESIPVALGATSGEVSAEWYTYNGNDLQVPPEPATATGDETPATTQATDNEREATKAADPEGSSIEQDPMPTSPLQKESQPAANGIPTATATRAASPRAPIAENQTDGDSMHPGTSKSPNLTSPLRAFAPQGHGVQPGGPWHYQPLHGHAAPDRFMPHFLQPPVPTASPAGFGLPFLPPPLPGNELARVEPPAISGYDLVASRLAGHPDSEPPVPPLYRRFKAMNHRILLGLQDELCCMEDNLQNLDNADTFHRSRFRDGIVPASRRQDNMDPSETTAARQALLDRVAYKLSLYNAHLNGFKQTLEFKDAMPEDVHDYRVFLAATSPVVPMEMRFLDKGTDLLCLPDSFYYLNDESVSGEMTPPVTRNPRLLEAPTAPTAPPSTMSMTDQVREYTAARLNNPVNNKRLRPLSPAALRHIAVGIGMAIILPILSFPVIAGFVSRMTVVMLVALGMVVVGVQSGIYDAMAARSSAVEGAIALGVYGGFMAIVAGTFG